MVFFKRLFCKKKDSNAESSVNSDGTVQRASSEMLYYIYFENEVYGGFTLSELKIDYGEYLEADTLITTDTLNNEWYKAKCFECFDELFNAQQGFRINEYGEIIRS
jgi:hypothetical protein